MEIINMTVICNIMSMAAKIGMPVTFKELENKKYNDLQLIQDKLIPLYNKKINENKQ